MNELLIKNEKLAQVVRTSSGLDAFEVAADNGQYRLAIDILNDLLPTVIEKIAELEERIDALTALPQPKPTSAKVKEEKSEANTEAK